METDFHGMWRAPRNVNDLARGLDVIISEYDNYRNKALQTAESLSWYNRSKELVEVYKQYAV